MTHVTYSYWIQLATLPAPPRTNSGTGPRDFVAHLLVRDPQTRLTTKRKGKGAYSSKYSSNYWPSICLIPNLVDQFWISTMFVEDIY